LARARLGAGLGAADATALRSIGLKTWRCGEPHRLALHSLQHDAAGAASDVSDTKCGIAVRRDGPAGCAPATAAACAPAANDLSNWVCNAATKNATTDCAAASPAWERCAKKN
jgi:hypothetical protein